MLEALWCLINLLTEAGFTDGTFNAQTLLECNHNRVIASGQSLLKTFSLLIGISDPEDNPTSLVGTADQRITRRITIDQALTPINDFPKDERTGWSRYASAKSDENSNDSFEIQRMSLGPRGADLLRRSLNGMRRRRKREIHQRRSS